MGTGTLAAGIDQLLAVEPDALTDPELHDLVVDVTRQSHRLAAARAALLAAWEARGSWAADGSRTAASRLARDTSTSVGTAKVELRRARALRAMPVTTTALADGELSADHVDLLARANHEPRTALFADHEETLVAQCRVLRYRDACRMVDYWRLRADAQCCEDEAQRQRDAAHLSASTTLDGDVILDGRLDPTGGATFLTELARLAEQLRLADQRDGTIRTAAQRRAAALVEMATRSATVAAGGRRPRPLFTVLVGDDTFSGMCELADGTVLTPGTLVAHLDRADLETILFDGPSTVISVSKRRTFTGALRRAIEVRDRHCQHPSGCDVPADQCDVDHIVPWTKEQETSQFGGRLECWTHNRHPAKHDHDATPQPARDLTYLDHLRARLRWQYLHDYGEHGDDEADDAGGEGDTG